VIKIMIKLTDEQAKLVLELIQDSMRKKKWKDSLEFWTLKREIVKQVYPC